MSQEEESKHRRKIIPKDEIEDKALEFVYYASEGIESIIADIESGDLTQMEAHKMIRRILADIRWELTEFPTKPIADEVCKNCLPDFNKCTAGEPACMNAYLLCARTCGQ